MNPNMLPLSPEEWDIARRTQAPHLMARIEYERTYGRNVPTEPSAPPVRPDSSQIAMAKQFATMYASMAPLTGGPTMSEQQILAKLCPSVYRYIDPNRPVNKDIPYARPGPQAANTQCQHFVVAGTSRFEVHNMDGIVVGQILSIGYEDFDIEHFRVAALGSVIAEEVFKNDHDALSPVKLVAASKVRQSLPCTGDAGIRGSRTIPRKSDEDSDIETEPPANTHVVTNRKVEWPHPAPTGHHDVEKWDSM